MHFIFFIYTKVFKQNNIFKHWLFNKKKINLEIKINVLDILIALVRTVIVYKALWFFSVHDIWK